MAEEHRRAPLPTGADLILVDGSVLEAGGQLLRNAVAYAALLCKTTRVNNVRAGRTPPGLKNQHMYGIILARDMCGGTLDGAELKSCEFTLTPGKLRGGSFLANIPTAGSICLLLQVAVPIAAFAPDHVLLDLRGGTNASMAPQVDYMILVLAPLIARMGVVVDVEVVRRGYFPKGGGEVHARVSPVKRPLTPIILEDFGHVVRICTRAYTAGNIPETVATRMAATARAYFTKRYQKGLQYEEQVVKETNCVGAGCGIIITAYTSTGCVLAGSALGEKGKTSEAVAEEACAMLQKHLVAEDCVDEQMQDQLIVFMALAGGISRIVCGEISLHTQTAIHVATQMTGAEFTIVPAGSHNTITCNGIGYFPSS